MAHRPETIAACASAIGALASAVAAIIALVFLSHQESIARKQVQATYLSNLFNKQVDAVASLHATILEFVSLGSPRLADIVEKDIPDPDINKYYDIIKERYSIYANMAHTITEKSEAVYLVMPKSIGSVLFKDAEDVADNITSTMYQFIAKKPAQETFLTFTGDMRNNVNQLFKPTFPRLPGC